MICLRGIKKGMCINLYSSIKGQFAKSKLIVQQVLRREKGVRVSRGRKGGRLQ